MASHTNISQHDKGMATTTQSKLSYYADRHYKEREQARNNTTIKIQKKKDLTKIHVNDAVKLLKEKIIEKDLEPSAQC